MADNRATQPSSQAVDIGYNMNRVTPQRPFMAMVFFPNDALLDLTGVIHELNNYVIVDLLSGTWSHLLPLLQSIFPGWGAAGAKPFCVGNRKIMEVNSARWRQYLTSQPMLAYQQSEFRFIPWNLEASSSGWENNYTSRIKLFEVPLHCRSREAVARIVGCFGDMTSVDNLSLSQPDLTVVGCWVDVRDPILIPEYISVSFGHRYYAVRVRVECVVPKPSPPTPSLERAREWWRPNIVGRGPAAGDGASSSSTAGRAVGRRSPRTVRGIRRDSTRGDNSPR